MQYLIFPQRCWWRV